MSTRDLLLRGCVFPVAGTPVTLAVSGGADSVGLLLLAVDAGLRVSVHHVDHHARPASGDDAAAVRALCTARAVSCVVHDVVVVPGANFEARARAARRAVLPRDSLTGHTLDDLAETVLLNMLRGAGVDGLSPMVGDPTKPLVGVRRGDLHDYVRAARVTPVYDESNDDLSFRRNRVRHQLLPLMNDVAGRDVVPLLARQARVLHSEREWLDNLADADAHLSLGDVDCGELREWPRARLRRWLRARLVCADALGERHPPSAAEVDRAVRVVVGDAVAAQLSGGRRLARRARRLRLEGDSTTLTRYG